MLRWRTNSKSTSAGKGIPNICGRSMTLPQWKRAVSLSPVEVGGLHIEHLDEMEWKGSKSNLVIRYQHCKVLNSSLFRISLLIPAECITLFSCISPLSIDEHRYVCWKPWKCLRLITQKFRLLPLKCGGINSLAEVYLHNAHRMSKTTRGAGSFSATGKYRCHHRNVVVDSQLECCCGYKGFKRDSKDKEATG